MPNHCCDILVTCFTPYPLEKTLLLTARSTNPGHLAEIRDASFADWTQLGREQVSIHVDLVRPTSNKRIVHAPVTGQ
jgi:hypothetical protein